MQTLAEELQSHFNESAADETPETPVVETVETPEAEPTGERARDEHGRFAKKEEQTEQPLEAKPVEAVEPVKPEEAKPEEVEDKTVNINRPPATWSAAAKAEFANLPETVRREIAKREGDMARGIQQHAAKAQMADRYLSEFQPYEAMFRAAGASPEQFIRNSLSTEYRLRTASPQEKTQLLMQYAQHYGADLSIIPQLLGMGQEPQEQNIQALVSQLVQQQVAPLIQQQQRASQEVQLAQEQEIMGQITAFQNATDETGNPKHLYFENVRGAMSALIGSGQARNLEEAYDMACYANPEVRAALIANEQRKAESERLSEAKRKAEEAKRLSFDVSGQGGVGIADTSKLSLRDELSARLTGGGRV